MSGQVAALVIAPTSLSPCFTAVPAAGIAWPSIVIARLSTPSPSSLWPRFGLALAFLLLAQPAPAVDLPSLHSDSAPQFTADVGVSVDPKGTPGLSLMVSLVYPELVWFKENDGFAGRFEVTAEFKPAAKGQIIGDAWQRQVRVSTFDQTTAFASTIVEQRTFQVPPGRYALKVVVRDLNSQMQSSVSGHFEVPDYSRVPLAIAA
jgi:hypothetical protein